MKIILSLSAVLISLLGFSQSSFQGIATYESKTSMGDFKISSPGMDEGQIEIIKARMAKAFEKTFELKFNTTESVYTEPQKLDKVQNSTFMVKGGEVNLYKNLKDKVALSEEDLFDKPFLVSEKLRDFKWQITPETKMIGAYNCQKAISITPVTAEEIAEYEASKNDKENASTNLTFTPTEPQEQIITVWFTTQIPVANGPNKYWGLPGLILEVIDGNTILLCSKVVLNPKNKFEIKKPKKGKPVTSEAFDKITAKKLESMKDENGVIQLSTTTIIIKN
jgi:GLPGLI family protein